MIHHWAAALFASAHISNVVLREEAGLSAPLHLFLGTSEQGRSQEGPGPRLPACLLGPLIVFHEVFQGQLTDIPDVHKFIPLMTPSVQPYVG